MNPSTTTNFNFIFVGHYLWGIDTYLSKSGNCLFSCSVGHYLWGIDTRKGRPSGTSPYGVLLHQQLFRRTLPMRNWYELAVNSRFALFVGHYLWGIDTFGPRNWFNSSCRTLPMRNWYLMKTLLGVEWHPQGDARLWPEPQTGRTLPMRNWYQSNLLLYISQSMKTQSRTLPMRNWYKCCCKLIGATIAKNIASDITYEELILLETGVTITCACLSDITYEELIHCSPAI